VRFFWGVSAENRQILRAFPVLSVRQELWLLASTREKFGMMSTLYQHFWKLYQHAFDRRKAAAGS
jgi:hypothetical protein